MSPVKKSAPKAAKAVPVKPAAKPAGKSVLPAKAAPKKVVAAAPKIVAKPAPKAAPKVEQSTVAVKATTKKLEPKPVGKTPAKAVAPKAKPRTVAVVFERYSPLSQRVEVVGSFNEWQTGANLLKRDANGIWKATLNLIPGTYEYQFVFDGISYEADPSQQQVPSPFGGSNNLLVVA